MKSTRKFNDNCRQKNKNKNHRKNHRKYGGKVRNNPILQKILSIGFEFETGNMTPILYNPTIDKFTITEPQPYKFPEINITSDIKLDITSESDTPRAVGAVDSLMSALEYNYKQTTNEFRTFVDNYLDIDKDEYGFYEHTEYMFTFIHANNNMNDPNIILKYFKYVVYYLKSCFLEIDKKMNESVDSKLVIYSNAHMSLNGQLLYLIPMKFNDNYTPATIKWVPQMTINVKVVDIIPVLEYLSSDLNRDSKESIINCKEFAYQIIPDFGSIDANEPKRKTRTQQLQMIPSDMLTESNKHIFSILRSSLFMLTYLCVYGSNEVDETVHIGIDKNHFDFLFRCSIARIIMSLCIRRDREEDVVECLNVLNEILKEEEKNIDMALTIRGVKPKQKLFMKQKRIACIAFIQFIDYLILELDNISLHTATDLNYLFERIYTVMELNEQSKIYKQSIQQSNDRKILPTISFFTEIFKSSSNYYPYDHVNESILIEFRSFSQDLLIEANDTSKNPYKNLNEWSEIIERIRNNQYKESEKGTQTKKIKSSSIRSRTRTSSTSRT